MSMTKKNIFMNENIPITNSVILNNYSIQNIIISPTKIVSHAKSPKFSNHLRIKSQVSYSPPTNQSNIKKASHFIDEHVEQTNFSKNFNPLVSYKSANKLKCYNIKNIQKSPFQNAKSIVKISYSPKKLKTEEKSPLDSAKKPNLKKIQNEELTTEKKFLLKNCVSQRCFKIIKRPNGVINNLAISQDMKNSRIIRPAITNTLFPKKKLLKSKSPYLLEPKGILNLEEFNFSEQIGKGTFGKIFCVKWNKNNKLYVLKREVLNDKETVQKRKEAFKIIFNFIKNTKNNGVINIYGNLLLRNNFDLQYEYYELMEKAERDWDQEINIRSNYNLYYNEVEILDITRQLISTLSLLQKYHMTHRDIKPQNILVINGRYKLCDFGEIRELKRDGLIVQRVRGSELYMSPILFKGLHLNLLQVRHNTYKSDVFSLGMCLFYACSLTYSGVDSIRELTNMEKIKEILFQHLGKKYSSKYIMFILQMLEVDEERRPDFIELEIKLKRIFP